MKRLTFLINSGVFIIYVLLIVLCFFGCSDSDDSTSESNQTHFVPTEKVGKWESSDSVYCDSEGDYLYLSIDIDNKGALQGVCDSYILQYQLQIFPYAWVCGKRKEDKSATGWIDFETNTGHLKCSELGETDFTFTINAKSELDITFPGGWASTNGVWNNASIEMKSGEERKKIITYNVYE